jgi:phospholipid/cholesterol/gamma-HCH transport system ATP-binding protein
MESMYKIADRVVMLFEGEVIFAGPPEEFRQCDHPRVRQFVERRPEQYGEDEIGRYARALTSD